MIQLSLTDEQLRLTDTDQLLTPTHRSMLTYWQFSKDYDSRPSCKLQQRPRTTQKGITVPKRTRIIGRL